MYIMWLCVTIEKNVINIKAIKEDIKSMIQYVKSYNSINMQMWIDLQ